MNNVMIVLQIIVLLLSSLILFITAFGALYQVFFAITSVFLCKKRKFTQQPTHSIVILIPAHNESSGLPSVLERCLAVDYPKELFSVTVIADNCTDDTARIAREYGVVCLERFDNERRGKGEALEWAIPQVLETHADAVMVLDADCYLDEQSLKACDFEMSKGNHVIQVPYLVSNPDVSFQCYCQSLARTMENLLFYWPKSKLGLSSFLIGSGMVFHRKILDRFPWRAGGTNEDFEYCFQLIKNRIKPVFVGDAGLVSPFPDDSKQLATQRARWVFGGLQTIRESVGSLFHQGIFHCNFVVLDAAVTMFYISRPVVFFQMSLSGLLAFACFYMLPSLWSSLLFVVWWATVALYLFYVVQGVFTLGLTWKRAKFLFLMPLFVIRYLEIAAKSLLVWRPREWERTPRGPDS